ncbi:MAG: 4Fe-4S dicluster domain-containing protein [Deltaproteobacteria bacterium]|nr:4Fe-4S dicluster domain-containing protein [Deltaproteobacteria bacterium]
MYSRMLVLRFPQDIVDRPLVCNLVREFDLSFNILKATILPGQEGLMIMELSGHRKNFNRGIKYLEECGVKIKTIGQDINRNMDKCFQCGACTAVCPTGALYIRRPEMEVCFEPEKCSGCELCVAACPVRAMEVHLRNASGF